MKPQDLANKLSGFELIASMNPPPGAAYQTAMDHLPTPEMPITGIAFDMSGFGNKGPHL